MANRKAKKKSDTMSLVVILGCASALLLILGLIGFAVNDFFYDGHPGWIGTSSAMVLSLGGAGFFATSLLFALRSEAPKQNKPK